ncbi:MAG TPA: cytochrome P450, partial [Roseiflexaceae bacterium]|nr:cytochrome P450 [Roseiflexaceae bacterium]
IDAAAAMRDLTLSIVAQVVFGLPPDARSLALLRAIRTWVELFTAPSTNILPLNVPGLPYWRLLRTSDALGAHLRALLAQRRAQLAPGLSAFDLLAQAQDADGQPLSAEAVLGQASLLFVAGHETSANALVWTLVLLALHPRVCTELVDEVVGIVGRAAPALEDLERLPLLDRVVRESLRLLPPAVYGVRHAQVAFSLGGYDLPAETTLIFSPFLTHRVSPVFERPAQFRPTRWETISPDPYEYIPFGAGPRRCLGETFALQEIKTVLILLLQRFQPELVAPARIDYRARITLSPAGTVPLRLRPLGEQIRPAKLTGSLRRLVDVPT